MLARRTRPWSLAATLLVAACSTTQPPHMAKLSVTTIAASGAQPGPSAAAGGTTGTPASGSNDGSASVAPGQSANPSSAAPSGSPVTGPSSAGNTSPLPSASASSFGSPSSAPSPSASQPDAGGGVEHQAPSSAPSATSSVGTVPNVPSVSTYAGRGQAGFIDTDAADAEFTAPQALVLQGQTALFVGDSGDNRIRRIDLSNKNVTTIAGNGAAAYQDGIGQNTSFRTIRGLAFDGSGNLYVADFGNNCIREIGLQDLSNANVSTFAGIQGSPGNQDTMAASATFHGVWGLAVSGSTMFVADQGNHCIRAIDLSSPGNPVTTYAGNLGSPGNQDGPASSATFQSPAGLALDAAGRLYVSDIGNHNIRLIDTTDPAHTVSTIAGAGPGNNGLLNADGTNAKFDQPGYLTVGPDGNLYVSDTNNNVIREVSLASSAHTVTTWAGAGMAGFLDATAPNAQFDHPAALLWNGSSLLLADPHNARVRVVQ